MFITDKIDAAGRKNQAPRMEKSADIKVEDDYALKLADLMDKQASLSSGESQDALTQALLSDILDEGQTGDKASKIQDIRSQLTEMGVLQ